MPSAKINVSLSTQGVLGLIADAMIIPVYQAEKKKSADTKKSASKAASKSKNWLDDFPALKPLDAASGGLLNLVGAEEKFDGGAGKMLSVRLPENNKLHQTTLKVKRIVVIGLGKADKAKVTDWDKQVQKAVSSLLGLKGYTHLALMVPETTAKLSHEVLLTLAVDAAHQATYKSAECKDKPLALDKLVLCSEKSIAGGSTMIATAQAMASARSLCKDLVNQPANLKTTKTLSELAKNLGKKSGLTATIQSTVSWIEKNMPCFYTVARGSVASDPPKWIKVAYKPTSSAKPKKHIAIVGKAVIFDTGGYQVKTGNYMNTMKGDMTGSAVVLSVMQALAELKPKNIAVSAYCAATPNKIDSDAMIPDSIVNTTCGKKVEIRHTDAEGRLTLIDAVAMAAKDKPDEMITIATLTGSASQAVGCSIALMGNDEVLMGKVESSARQLGDPVQSLEVRDDDYNAIKSKLDSADLINTTHAKGRGAQSAAAFVMSGAPEGLAMAHLDIAGADMTPDEKATGIGVKTLLAYLLAEDTAKDDKGSAKKTAAKKH